MSGKRNLMTRLEYRFSRFAVSNLMLYVVGAMALLYIADFAVGSATGQSLTTWLMFDRAAIFHGQVWRLLTFVFLPPDTSVLWIVFALYFNYLIGRGLEQQWGAFRFNLFYLTGILLSIAAGLIVGQMTNVFLNASLFFAFALLYPDFQVMLFFFIPVKIKWLAALDALFYVLMLILGTWSTRAAILVALGNLVLFFWPDIRWHAGRITGNLKLRRQRAASRRRYK